MTTESSLGTAAKALDVGPAQFLSRYGRVLEPGAETGGVVPFTLWSHLEALLQIWLNNRLVIVLKAKQIGVSWLCAGYALWHIKRYPGARALLLSKSEGDSSDLLTKSKFIEAGLPPEMQYRRGKDNDSVLEFPDFRSRILALPSTKSAGIGHTASLVMMDEFAFHPYASENIQAILPTMAARGQLIIVSTAHGTGGEFAATWDGAESVLQETASNLQVGDEPGKNRFLQVFVPWWARPGRDEAWLAERRAEYKFEDGPTEENYPSTAEEAFIQSGRPIFGEGLVECFTPAGRVTLPTSHPSAANLPSIVGFTAYTTPNPRHRYLIGADPAQGLLHGDASCAIVLDASTYEEVAFLHERVPPDTFAEHLHLLATLYSGLLAVERNNHGHAVLVRLRQLLSTSHHAPYSLYRDPGGPLRTPAGRIKSVQHAGLAGWLTTGASKPVMISELEEAIRKGYLKLHTPLLKKELSKYERKDDGSTGAPSGKTDDSVIALAIAYQMRKWLQDRPVSGKRPIIWNKGRRTA